PSLNALAAKQQILNTRPNRTGPAQIADLQRLIAQKGTEEDERNQAQTALNKLLEERMRRIERILGVGEPHQ
ncbi:MAG: hypothetical protein HC806_01730, partial [Anaerolineae bacterium]|nr:hypothetical protein [Anaerolineae bacterium]